jgi:hypothetical protein
MDGAKCRPFAQGGEQTQIRVKAMCKRYHNDCNHIHSPSKKASSCFIQDKGGSNSVYTKNQTISAIYSSTAEYKQVDHQSFAYQ